jgi:Cu(I)/Ag(I) efflux system protein CusF
MKHLALAATVLFLAGCNAAPPAPPAPPAPATAPATTDAAPAMPAAPMAETKHATATGVVQAVDASAHTLTIAHGPVESLGWPEMTMNFTAPGVDLEAIKPGDTVSFEFDSTGMNGVVTAIAKQ